MSKHGEQCTVVLRSRAGRCRHREAIAAGISGDATQTETGVSADYETATDGDRSRTPMEGNNIMREVSDVGCEKSVADDRRQGSAEFQSMS